MSKKIGALWRVKKVGDNQPKLTGTLELIIGSPVKIAIFENKAKKSQSSPDFNVVISEFKKEDEPKIKVDYAKIPAGMI